MKKYGSFLRTAWPVTVGEAGVILVSITDVLFIAGTGQEADLAAVAFISTFYATIFHTLKGLINGGEVLIARRNGEGKFIAIGELMSALLLIILWISILMLGAILFGGQEVLQSLINNPSILTSSHAYLLYRSIGLPIGLVTSVFVVFFIGIQHTQILAIYMVAKVLVNVVLNYALILGNWGFSELGIQGAAMASAFADLAGLLVVVFYMWYIRVELKKYGLFTQSIFRINKGLSLQVFQQGTPLAVQAFFAFGFYAFFFVLIEKMGTEASSLAAMAVAVSDLAMIVRKPFSIITSSVVSNAIGAGSQIKQINQQANQIALITTIATFFVVLVILWYRVEIIHLFTKAHIPTDNAFSMLYMATLTAIVAAPAGIYFKVLIGTGATRLSMLSASVSTLLCHGLLATWLVSCQVDLMYVWGAEMLYWVSLGLMTWQILLKKKGLIKRL